MGFGKAVEGEKDFIEVLDLLLTATNRDELEVEENSPELCCGIRFSIYGADEEVVKFGEKCSEGLEIGESGKTSQ